MSLFEIIEEKGQESYDSRPFVIWGWGNCILHNFSHSHTHSKFDFDFGYLIETILQTPQVGCGSQSIYVRR